MTARKPVSLEQRASAVLATIYTSNGYELNGNTYRKVLRELRAAVRAEREACARECFVIADRTESVETRVAAEDCAQAIRERPKL